jgi:hypothetical protein
MVIIGNYLIFFKKKKPYKMDTSTNKEQQTFHLVQVTNFQIKTFKK